MKKRIFVEKKEGFKTEAKSLMREVNEALGLFIADVRIINIYDLFNIENHELEIAKKQVLSEIVTDNVYSEINLEGKVFFAMQFLEGQYDQRADWATQSLLLLTGNENAIIKSGKIIVLEGASGSDLERIKKFVINPIESREFKLDDPISLEEAAEPTEILTHEEFLQLSEKELSEFLANHNMAMTLADIKHIQDYFKNEENRNPTETELKVLDTYWSDHCRHTTFETILQNIKFKEGNFKEMMQKAFDEYLEMRNFVYEVNEKKRPITLMDMAVISAKYERKKGNLEDIEISDEINACSLYIDIEIDGKTEPYLLMFKNETHNHPTEIEPFGGASTCIGGCIRDPLSGRAFVYQAMRISGAADILEPIENTLASKLPQRTISKVSAHGNSSYGNQIGLATTFVREVHHPGFKAKHMEVGAVVAAAPLQNVKREQPEAGDIVILLGGATGRDGIGGATGSSKSHNTKSNENAATEVQKGNAPEERKIQRLFRNEKVTTLIKKCNDFGAGGVAVAVGELADGLIIDLNAVPLKYKGLNGTEIAISESQERMAVIVSPSDAEKFIEYARDENLDAVKVAEVTNENRLIMNYDGKSIVNISRDFLNTNGEKSYMDVQIETDIKENIFESKSHDFLENLAQPNVASKQGMIEMFDASIGAGSVLMPFGGKYQLTETEGSVHKISVLNGQTNKASILTFGYDPEISAISPFHGAAYAVVESIAKVVALGGKWQGIRFSFQEYFRKLGKDETLWGEPVKALLGALSVQKEFGLPSIGGKDSMSGSFENLHVPPTLISFAVQTEEAHKIISSEFKEENSYIYLIKHTPKKDMMPNIDELKENFDFIYYNKDIISAFSVKQGGISEAIFKMSFGNKIGADIETHENLFEKQFGSIIVESPTPLDFKNAHFLGRTGSDQITINQTSISIDLAIQAWQGTFNGIFPKTTNTDKSKPPQINYEHLIIKPSGLKTSPCVLIPTFPGTNSEYDSEKAFKLAGAKTKISVFKNLTPKEIKETIDNLAKEIKSSQILMLPGGFSAGDEPDGSAKFITAVLNNEKIRESIEDLLARDGLIIGICNGFQALIKSGLLPYKDLKIAENSPTLAHNNIGRHQSKIIRTRFTGANSPWFNGIKAGDIHNVAISHGEGKFTAGKETINKLVEDGLVAFQYVDLNGNPTMDELYNPNGSTIAIEGIISPCGKIFGKMGHTERSGENIFKNVTGNYDQKIFKSGVEYFTK
ncbi:MAG: phosphoribosylformylglycinamidine synthase [Defluviitaleaceae bacterium]|nr:phosphoribosylformylglycinamidine synthase [Defluviitaleaceae bacterium]